MKTTVVFYLVSLLLLSLLALLAVHEMPFVRACIGNLALIAATPYSLMVAELRSVTYHTVCFNKLVFAHLRSTALQAVVNPLFVGTIDLCFRKGGDDATEFNIGAFFQILLVQWIFFNPYIWDVTESIGVHHEIHICCD